MGSLGRLNVSLVAETAQFVGAMDKAAFTSEMRMKQMQRQARIAGAAIGAAMVAGATAFAIRMKQIIDGADQMSKMSQKLGITTEALSAMKYQAELTGTNFDELTKAVVRMSRTASDANNGLATARRAFDALGISVIGAAGELRSADDLLLDVADKFSKMADGTQKAALAQELFGRSGVAMIPFLNKGRDGLEDMRKEAERLGVILSTKTGLAAEAFNDNLTRLKARADGLFLTIGNHLIPTLVDLTDVFGKTSGNMDSADRAGKALAATLINLITAGRYIGEVFGTVGRTIGDFAATVFLASQGKFKEAMAAMEKSSLDTNNAWASIIEDQMTLLNNLEARSQTSADAFEPVARGAERVKQAIAEIEAETKKTDKVTKDLNMTFSSAFEDAVINGKKFQDVLKSLEQDLLRLFLRRAITEPLFNSIFPVASAKGNAFNAGHVLPFARGGVIGGPISFPLGRGMGIAGESGPEAILPLGRTRSGDLGIKSDGRSVVVNVYAPPGAEVTEDRSFDGGTERINIFIDEAVANNLRPGTKTFRAMKESFGLGQRLINR